jgi:hypothetical protein
LGAVPHGTFGAAAGVAVSRGRATRAFLGLG